MPVRVVLGRGVTLRRTAGSQAGRGDHLAGEDGRDVLRRIDGGAALALVGRGFRTGPWRVGRGGTPRLGARCALRGPRTRRVEAQKVHQSRSEGLQVLDELPALVVEELGAEPALDRLEVGPFPGV